MRYVLILAVLAVGCTPKVRIVEVPRTIDEQTVLVSRDAYDQCLTIHDWKRIACKLDPELDGCL